MALRVFEPQHVGLPGQHFLLLALTLQCLRGLSALLGHVDHHQLALLAIFVQGGFDAHNRVAAALGAVQAQLAMPPALATQDLLEKCGKKASVIGAHKVQKIMQLRLRTLNPQQDGAGQIGLHNAAVRIHTDKAHRRKVIGILVLLQTHVIVWA
jgi:hypothetical protein